MKVNYIIISAIINRNYAEYLTCKKLSKLKKIIKKFLEKNQGNQSQDVEFIIISDVLREFIDKMIVKIERSLSKDNCATAINYTVIESEEHRNFNECVKTAIKMIPNDEPFMFVWSDKAVNASNCESENANLIHVLCSYKGRKFLKKYTNKNNKKDNENSDKPTAPNRYKHIGGQAVSMIFSSKNELGELPNNGSFLEGLSMLDLNFKVTINSKAQSNETSSKSAVMPIRIGREHIINMYEGRQAEKISVQHSRFSQHSKKFMKFFRMASNFINSLVNKHDKLYRLFLLFTSGAFSVFAICIADTTQKSLIYTILVFFIGILVDIIPTNAFEKLIKLIANISNFKKGSFLILFALLPTISGFVLDKIEWNIEILLFDNLVPNLFGAAIVISICCYLSKFSKKEMIYALLRYKEDFFRLFCMTSVNLSILNAINYTKNETWMARLNGLYLGIIVFFGMVSVCTFALRIIVNKQFNSSIKSPYPISTLFFLMLFILSYALPSIHQNETMLIVMDALALNLVMWFFFVFIYRRSYKKHPYRPWFLWLLISLISCCSVIYICLTRANDSEVGYGLIGVAICIFTILMLLYVNHKQIKQTNEANNHISGRISNCDNTALIVGVTSDIGKCLTEILRKKNYNIFGMDTSTSDNTNKFVKILKNTSGTSEPLNETSLTDVIVSYKPTEIYNFSALTDYSYCDCESDDCCNIVNANEIFNAIKEAKIENNCRFFQASTSSLYCIDTDEFINEFSPFKPSSIRSVTEAYSAWIVRVYREKQNFFAANGILFDHDSEHGSRNSLIRRIANEASELSQGKQPKECLYDLNRMIDIGYTKDYAHAVWLSLQKKYSADYVIATGKPHSVREIYTRVFKQMKMQLIWEGEGINEVGKCKNTGRVIIKAPSNGYCSYDGFIKCDPTKSEEELDLNYDKILFEEMINLIVQDVIKQNKDDGI